MISTTPAPVRADTSRTGKPTHLSAIRPRRADLVEDFRTGARYLRAFADGHYYWQPVDGAADALSDGGVWTTGHEWYQIYWLNLGTFRRSAGRFVSIAREPAATAA